MTEKSKLIRDGTVEVENRNVIMHTSAIRFGFVFLALRPLVDCEIIAFDTFPKKVLGVGSLLLVAAQGQVVPKSQPFRRRSRPVDAAVPKLRSALSSDSLEIF